MDGIGGMASANNCKERFITSAMTVGDYGIFVGGSLGEDCR